MSNINDHINHLAYAQRQQTGVNSQIQQALGDINNRLNAIGQAQEVSIQGASQPDRPRQIEDIPGARTPRWYEVDIDFALGDTSLSFNSAEIAPDGPFIITQCAPWWLVTDTNAANFQGPPAVAPTGRTLPCTAAPLLLNGGALTNPATALNLGNLAGTGAGVLGGIVGDIPEFSFQIEIAGSGRFWTNVRTPAASFYGWGGQPNYLGVQGWVERTDRIVVHATPEIAIPHAGRVRFVFEGYQILGPVNISEQLGL